MSQREWMEAFINLYRSEPCLWKLTSKEYHDRTKKDAAYEKLILKYREIEPSATRELVIKKINNLRCTYRKEYKKVKSSMASGSEQVYEPKLWYYPLLSFLDDCCRMSISESGSFEIATSHLSSSIEASTETFGDSLSHDDWILAGNNFLDSTDTSASAGNAAYDTPARDTPSVQSTSSSTQHRFDLFGQSVGMHLRELIPTQALLAQKIIQETLAEAGDNRLTRLHRVMAPPCQHVRSPARPNYCLLCDDNLDIPLPVLEYRDLEALNTFQFQ